MRQFRDTPFLVTEDGRVFSADGRSKDKRPRLRPQRMNSVGYYRVTDYRDGKSVDYYVHHLVMECYGEPCPGTHGSKKGDYNIHHKNDDKTDNNLSNLEWIEQSHHSSHSQKGRDLANDEVFKQKCREARLRSIK